MPISIFKSDLHSQSNLPKEAKFLKQPKTDGYWIMQFVSMRNLKKISGTAQNIIFGRLLSYESEIYPSLIQEPNMTEQSQRRRNIAEGVRMILWYQKTLLDTSLVPFVSEDSVVNC